MRSLTRVPQAGRGAGVFVHRRSTGFAAWAEGALRGGCGFGVFGPRRSTGVWMTGAPARPGRRDGAVWSRLLAETGGAAWSR